MVLESRNRKIKVNSLLDEASTTTYINSLQVSLISRKVTVNVLNGQAETFDTVPVVEVELESLDGNVRRTVSVFATEKVTGNLEAIDWEKYASKWPHLKDIKFRKPGPHHLVYILIGIDQVDLPYSFKDIKGKPGEPVARLTSLG